MTTSGGGDARHAKMEIVRGAGGDALRVHLEPGQRVRAESDAAVSMSENVEVRGTVHGGVLSGVRRAILGGESVFQQELACRGGVGGAGGDAVLAAPDPGALAVVPVSPDRGLHSVQGAFVCCDAGVTVDAGLRGASLLNGMLSRQGLFAVSMRGSGSAVVHGIGGLMEHALGAGEARRVDNGHLVAWSDSCSVTATAGSGSVIGSVTSGEGVMLLVRGPGRIWVQSHKASSHSSRVNYSRGNGRRGRGGGWGGGGLQIDGAVGNCVGILFTTVCFAVFVGTFAYFAYLTFSGEGEWVQRGGGSWSWVPNEEGGGGGSSAPFGGYVEGVRGRCDDGGRSTSARGGGRSEYHDF